LVGSVELAVFETTTPTRIALALVLVLFLILALVLALVLVIAGGVEVEAVTIRLDPEGGDTIVKEGEDDLVEALG
jgi:hypothetical protein